jgi:SAM-dependent methyltransferase
VSATATSSEHYTFKDKPESSHRQLLDLLAGQGEGLRVLDLGCGPGHLAELLARRRYRVVAVDRPGACRARGASFDLVEADLENGLPAGLGHFDYVVCADVLEHLRDPASLLRQIHGVLAPGGQLVASLPNSGNIYFRLVILSGRFPQDEKGLFDRTHLRFFTWAGWRNLLDEAGFRVERAAVTGIPAGLRLPAWDGGRVIGAVEAVLRTLARGWKTLWAYQFVVVAKAKGVQ